MPRQAKDNCANPLLRDWIGEWMEQARGHHTKAYYTYKKAYESISKCPIPFNHPSEAKMVKGIGDGMVARLEKRMAKYCQENGLPMPTRASGSGSGSKRAGEQLDDASQESGKRQRRAPRTYVPRYRSGSYAILLALSQQSEEFNQQCATKEEIIRIAQNHCNSSFDMPEPGKNYTAWNSIKMLINKGYVWKQGNPPKYMLTESGVEMASHLKNTLHNGGSIHASQSRTSSSQRNLMEEEDGDDDEEEEEEIDLSLYVLDPEKCRNDTQHSETASTPAASTSRASQSQSAMNFNPATLSMSQSSFDNDILLSTQPDSTQPNESKKQTNKDYDYDEGTDDIIFLDCLPSPPAAHVPSTSANLPLSSTPSTPSSALNDSQPIQSDASLVFEYTYLDLRGNPTRHASQALADIDASTNGLMYQIRFSSKQRTHPKAQNLRRVKQEANGTLTGYISEFDADIICPGLPPEPVLPLREKEGQDDDFWPRRKIIPSSQGQSSRSQEISSLLSLSQLQNEPLSQDPNEDVSFPPGSYEIVLVLDNREIKMKSNRDYFQEQLIEKGVPIVKRALELGDVIWVARKRGSKSPGDELFLDLVIERKRMDDLVASIKDGRFHEQKYRLHQSGAKKVIYIVEEYNKEAAVQFGAQAIQTAMSSTQVVDGFFLKRTASIDDTIEYLVTLNTMVQKMYEGVTLYRIPEHKVSRQNYLEFKKKLDKHHLISYPLYNRLNSKTGTMTLHDIYLRMLMTIRGVSAEKAMALARVYPTPVSLLRAFSGTNEQEGKKLAQNATKDGINRRRWNNPLSERLYKIWGQLDYEDA